MEVAASYNMPVGEFHELHPHDQDSMLAHRAYRADCCDQCGTHPSVWKPSLGGHPNAVVAEWMFCRVCEVIANARDAGPPGQDGDTTPPGWHLITRNRQQ